jgi:methyl-accepting chemotaxis protein
MDEFESINKVKPENSVHVFSRLIDYIFLPKEISQIERAHVTKINRLALKVAWLHLPLFMLVAYFCKTGVTSAMIYSAMVLAIPSIASLTMKNPRHVALIFGFTSMCLGALLVHFGRSSVQIEMHFHFFVFLALLSVYGIPMVIIVSAITVALHHLAFWLFVPTSVFNYDA